MVSDNYLDNAYHVPYAHKALGANLDLASYSATIHEGFSIQVPIHNTPIIHSGLCVLLWPVHPTHTNSSPIQSIPMHTVLHRRPRQRRARGEGRPLCLRLAEPHDQPLRALV